MCSGPHARHSWKHKQNKNKNQLTAWHKMLVAGFVGFGGFCTCIFADRELPHSQDRGFGAAIGKCKPPPCFASFLLVAGLCLSNCRELPQDICQGRRRHSCREVEAWLNGGGCAVQCLACSHFKLVVFAEVAL